MDLKAEQDFIDACDHGDIATIKRQLSTNKHVKINGHIQSGFTALMKAACQGHLEVVDYLLSNGAFVDIVDNVSIAFYCFF